MNRELCLLLPGVSSAYWVFPTIAGVINKKKSWSNLCREQLWSFDYSRALRLPSKFVKSTYVHIVSFGDFLFPYLNVNIFSFSLRNSDPIFVMSNCEAQELCGVSYQNLSNQVLAFFCLDNIRSVLPGNKREYVLQYLYLDTFF